MPTPEYTQVETNWLDQLTYNSMSGVIYV